VFSFAVLASAFSGSGGAALVDPVRAVIYQGAAGAFAASPIFGHGMIGFNEVAASFMPTDNRYVYEHLHSDIADFAVIGGVLGMISYTLLLLAPLAGAWRVRSPARPAVLYLAVMASSGYLLMGLTNAMFGILTQTVLYGLMLALIVVLSRRPAP
jgi:O-antigen ligase